MKYKFIKDNSDDFPVKKMVKYLNINRSSYYKWLTSADTRFNRAVQEKRVIQKIRSIQEDTRYSYGIPTITEALKNTEYKSNHKKIARILRENGLNHKRKKKFKITTDSNHKHNISPNVLNRDFTAYRPNQKWVSDITYIWSSEGWVYLCVVIDLFSRKVVGWAISSRINTDLLMRAFWHAVNLRKPPKGLIFHSDRGSQYCSNRFRNALKSLSITQSMSRKGNCWDNACAESFFKSLKSDWIYDIRFDSREEVKNVLFEYIEIFYNRKRLHSYLEYETPEKFEFKMVA